MPPMVTRCASPAAVPLRSRSRRGSDRLPANPNLEELRDALGGHGLGEVEALRELTAHVTEESQLLFGFDTLGDRDEAEAAHERDDRLHELERPVAGMEVADEAPVDLDAVDREAIEEA